MAATYEQPAHMVIADTILSQLGGNRFVAMTGAKSLTANGTGLTVRLPQNFAKGGINVVRVDLTPADEYTVTCFKVRGTTVRKVSETEHVYCDSLRRVFELETGLRTSL